MYNNRRTQLQVLVDILGIINEGEEKPTRIMSALNFSWVPTQALLKRCVDAGYVANSNVGADLRSSKVFRITDSGKAALEQLTEAEVIMTI